MDLKFYLAMLWRNKWVIIITTFVTVAVVATLTYLMTPTYTAKATLRVATAANASVSYTDYMYADRLMNTYVKLATSSPILTELKEKLGITKAPEIKVTTVPNTELIQITIQSSDPALAQDAANTLGDILVAQSKDLYSGTGKNTLQILTEQLALAESELKKARQDLEALVGAQSKDEEVIAAANSMIQLREKTYASLLDEYEQARLRDALRENTISVVEPAIRPLSPSQPRKVINIGLGIVIGLCGGIGLAFVMENLNTHLYTTRQIVSTTGLTLLSKIPRVKRKQLLPSKNGHQSDDDPIHEAIRRLRTSVLAHSTNGSNGTSNHTFLITSSEPGEGKTTIAVHLAAAMAQYYQKVVLVDTDMRLPTVHKILSIAKHSRIEQHFETKSISWGRCPTQFPDRIVRDYQWAKAIKSIRAIGISQNGNID